MKTFTKFQKTPPMRRHKKSPPDISEIDDDNIIDPKIYRSHCHLDKDSLQTNVSTSHCAFQIEHGERTIFPMNML